MRGNFSAEIVPKHIYDNYVLWDVYTDISAINWQANRPMDLTHRPQQSPTKLANCAIDFCVWTSDNALDTYTEGGGGVNWACGAPSLNVGGGMGCQSTPAKFVASAVFALAPSKWRQTSKSMGKHMVKRMYVRVHVCVCMVIYSTCSKERTLGFVDFEYEGFSINKPDFP